MPRGKSTSKNSNRGTPEYGAWADMKTRCLNPRHKWFKEYGGRGITVCERWLAFDGFIADMGKRPGKGYSLDRINNDGNYEPGNCRWATAREQMLNRRRTARILIEGKEISLVEAADIAGVCANVMRWRVKHWPAERWLSRPREFSSVSPRLIEFNGVRLSMKEWAARIGITSEGLAYRLKAMPLEKALACVVYQPGSGRRRADLVKKPPRERG